MEWFRARAVTAKLTPEPPQAACYTRHLKHEDTTAALQAVSRDNEHLQMLMVADGHGGQTTARMLATSALQAVVDETVDGSGASLRLACERVFARLHTQARTHVRADGERNLSGATLSLVIYNATRRELTVANVGDSEAILVHDGASSDGAAVGGVPKNSAAGGLPSAVETLGTQGSDSFGRHSEFTRLTTTHRLADSAEEQERISALPGCSLAQATDALGRPGGPLRAWPGGLAVTRTIGDLDCGDAVCALPTCQTIPAPPGGGLVIVCSDGVWDALSFKQVCAAAATCSLARSLVAARPPSTPLAIHTPHTHASCPAVLSCSAALLAQVSRLVHATVYDTITGPARHVVRKASVRGLSDDTSAAILWIEPQVDSQEGAFLEAHCQRRSHARKSMLGRRESAFGSSKDSKDSFDDSREGGSPQFERSRHGGGRNDNMRHPDSPYGVRLNKNATFVSNEGLGDTTEKRPLRPPPTHTKHAAAPAAAAMHLGESRSLPKTLYTPPSCESLNRSSPGTGGSLASLGSLNELFFPGFNPGSTPGADEQGGDEAGDEAGDEGGNTPPQRVAIQADYSVKAGTAFAAQFGAGDSVKGGTFFKVFAEDGQAAGDPGAAQDMASHGSPSGRVGGASMGAPRAGGGRRLSVKAGTSPEQSRQASLRRFSLNFDEIGLWHDRGHARVIDESFMRDNKKYVGEGEFAKAFATSLDGRDVVVKILKVERQSDIHAVQVRTRALA